MVSNPNFKPMDGQQREEVRLKRIADQEYAKEHLTLNRPDEPYWKVEASARGIRMPQWHILGTEVKYVKRACKKLGIDVKEYVESTGFKTLKEFAENNSKFNAVAMVGLVIEYAVDKEL
jgi:hypothetical protein